VLARFKDEKATSLDLFDGKRVYLFSSMLSNKALLQVRTISDGDLPPMEQTIWPSTLFRPYLEYGLGMGGQAEIVESPPIKIPGTVLLRYHFDGNRIDLADYYIDPRRDYLCLKRILWARGTIRQKEFEDDLSELRQLPGGHWWAAKRTSQYYGTAGGDAWLNTRSINIQPLADSDFSPSTFDGDNLLQRAKAARATIVPF
jgi:hypothetical protein